ncbi:RnfABCDGE type electron transport complex subunit D [Candidatus Microgenomates bacterium]|nr:RnfABCDGE type electron transport complex subunit D [Candidatus Microgenomates bacterium]
MARLWIIPKVRMVLALSALTLPALIHYFSPELILRLILILSSTLILEYLFWRIRRIEPFLPSAGVVSALIIFLLADPNSSWYLTIIAVVIAIITKQFLRLKKSHIFNPAASGLLIASIFGLPVTWWGVSWGLLLPLIATILLGAWVSMYTIKQHRIILSFIISSIVAFNLIAGQFTTQSLLEFSVASVWFFTLIMLPEPMTAAHFPKTKILYGILVGVLPFLLGPLFNLPVEPLLASLLIGNLVFFIVEKKEKF